MRFAHISDIHLGFQKDGPLQEIEQRVFEGMMDECIKCMVDFVLISGDMFHVNIPEMRVQRYAFAKFKEVYDAGIPVYAIYGSHDFSPVYHSVIDLLVETGYIIKPKAASNDDGTISLEYITDRKTGAKIAGLSGLKMGRDREWYEKLDRADESGFKIFLFHGGIKDMKTDTSMEGDLMPLSLLPSGFQYYAGGHMHKWNHQSFEGYPHVVYPGTPFAGYYADLEDNARGQPRGFALVEFDSVIKNVEFVEMDAASYELIEVDAGRKKAESVNKEIDHMIKESDARGKIVIVKITGEMTSGKTSEIDTAAIHERLLQKGSIITKISKNKLTSKEYSITGAKGRDRGEIEDNIFFENIGQCQADYKELKGKNGVRLAKDMLASLSGAQLSNERKEQYAARIRQDALRTLGLE